MSLATWKRATADRGERFPTEWSLNDWHEPDGGRQQSEDARPEGRRPVSSAEEILPGKRDVLVA
jgi:hypothetical protein